MRHVQLLGLILLATCVALNQPIIASNTNVIDIPTAQNGMVSSQEATATLVGVEILKQGGNAVDAAVAVGFALAVTYPRAGNLGGGGFMLVYQAENNTATSIDYRETAPAAAFEICFLMTRVTSIIKRRDLVPYLQAFLAQWQEWFMHNKNTALCH